MKHYLTLMLLFLFAFTQAQSSSESNIAKCPIPHVFEMIWKSEDTVKKNMPFWEIKSETYNKLGNTIIYTCGGKEDMFLFGSDGKLSTVKLYFNQSDKEAILAEMGKYEVKKVETNFNLRGTILDIYSARGLIFFYVSTIPNKAGEYSFTASDEDFRQ